MGVHSSALWCTYTFPQLRSQNFFSAMEGARAPSESPGYAYVLHQHKKLAREYGVEFRHGRRFLEPVFGA